MTRTEPTLTKRYRVPNCFIRLSMYFDHSAGEGLSAARNSVMIIPPPTGGALTAVVLVGGVLSFEAVKLFSACIIVNLMFAMPCDH